MRFPWTGVWWMVALGCAGDGPGWGLGGQHNPLPGGQPDDSGEPGGDDTAQDDTAQGSGDSADSFGADCALALGATACDLNLSDGAGQPWSLWEQRGAPVLLVVGHAWDGAMQLNSAALPDVLDGRTLTAAPVLLDNLYLQSATAADAAAWAQQYNLELALADTGGEARAGWMQTSQAQTWLLDAALTVVWVGYGPWDAASVGARVDALAEAR